MTYQAKFEGWKSLTLGDLLVAYRKAKADCFFDNAFPTAVKFADYEQNLQVNLEALLKNLQTNGFSGPASLLGECRLIPKKLNCKPDPDAQNGHTHFSDPAKAFKHLLQTHDLTPEFRIVGDFPVDTHIISALWVNMIGHKFDACLAESCYGSRLKRIRDEESLDKKAPKPFHVTAIGSFAPYFQPYQKWRNDGLKAIRNELEQKRQVVAVSLDLRSYFHLIDPAFIAAPGFQAAIGLSKEAGTSLSPAEQEFTQQLANFLATWSAKAQAFGQNLCATPCDISGGLVIGLSASRIISNVLLKRWDDLIREKLTPVHYGRYVDDMFLVLHDPGTIDSPECFMRFLQERLGADIIQPGAVDDDPWQILLGGDYQKGSRIELQPEKQKLFILEGSAGCDLLDSIEKEINDLSSEHRLMPSPDQLEQSTAAQVLSAAGKVGEEADTLRRADSLTIRRLSWSLQLRHVHTLANDLPRDEWKKERAEFYQFAHNHILRPDKMFAHYQHLPRLLGVAVSLGDWIDAEQIVNASFESLSELAANLPSATACINGSDCEIKTECWRYVCGAMAWSFIDIAARNYPLKSIGADKPIPRVNKLAKTFFDHLFNGYASLSELLELPLSSSEFYAKAPLLAVADLAAKPYKHLIKEHRALLFDVGIKKEAGEAAVQALDACGLLNAMELHLFLAQTRGKRYDVDAGSNDMYEPISGLIFPTRPYSPAEIGELLPACIGLQVEGEQGNIQQLAKYVRLLRGVWVNPSLLDEQLAISGKTDDVPNIVVIGKQKKKQVLVGISNLQTEDECWAGSACNKPVLTMDRYKRLSELVNQVIRQKPRPDYFLLPELSLPLKWVESVTNRLLAAGISVIAGTEYRHGKDNQLYSEACLALVDDQLGYRSSVRIWQPKLQPAAGEDQNLIAKFGKSWVNFDRSKKPVYNHNGFHFGLMICSELQNSKERVRFQGEVDALLVLSWNQDLDTFSALIESAAIDLHAYTVLVNNRKYGDSRVRSPAKESFERDMARLRGGKNDFCVTVALDFDKLRAFQSRVKRWPNGDDPFKPVPEGYDISSSRKRLPPK